MKNSSVLFYSKSLIDYLLPEWKFQAWLEHARNSTRDHQDFNHITDSYYRERITIFDWRIFGMYGYYLQERSGCRAELKSTFDTINDRVGIEFKNPKILAWEILKSDLKIEPWKPGFMRRGIIEDPRKLDTRTFGGMYLRVFSHWQEEKY